MILSAEKIRELLQHPAADPADRLVISPLLDMEKQCKAGTASVDVRLGQRFHVPLQGKIVAIGSTFRDPSDRPTQVQR